MPVTKMFLRATDIAAICGVHYNEASNVMRMFEMRGQVVRITEKGHKMVAVDVFTRFLCDQDGSDYKERKKEIQRMLAAMKDETADIHEGGDTPRRSANRRDRAAAGGT